MSDEHQWEAMSGTGHHCAKTPNLDALATRGTRFSNAYTPSPICVPARASFATGRHVHDIRLWDNAMPYTGEPKGWGHALQDRQIRVESIGKLHYRDENDPAGFDVEHIPMQVANGVGMVWGSIRAESERLSRPGRMLGDYIGPGESSYTKYDRSVTDETVRWMEQTGSAAEQKPWCLYVGLVAPHFPLVVPQEFLDLYPVSKLPPNKQHPSDGYQQHPWIRKQEANMPSESKFRDPEERLMAIACYFGLISWLDSNVGKILQAVTDNGFAENTTVIYTSDHGDNVGARGLWGKSNLYEEAAAIPLIVAPPVGKQEKSVADVCDTPVSLIDVAETIIDHFDTELPGDRPGKSLYAIAGEDTDTERAVLSEYHAVGAVSGAFMLRKGRYKYIHYHGFEPELFDLHNDPGELNDLAADSSFARTKQDLHQALVEICDPAATNALAFADQAAMIEGYGGIEKAMTMGAPAATPPPEIKART
jgi:choline-sulfatase